ACLPLSTSCFFPSFLSPPPPPPCSTLFPYTTLFRSDDHRLRLVVRDVEGRDREGLVEPADLEAHFFSQVCIEVAQRLVEEQNLRSEEHTSELQSPDHLVCRLLLEKKKKTNTTIVTDK